MITRQIQCMLCSKCRVAGGGLRAHLTDRHDAVRDLHVPDRAIDHIPDPLRVRPAALWGTGQVCWGRLVARQSMYSTWTALDADRPSMLLVDGGAAGPAVACLRSLHGGAGLEADRGIAAAHVVRVLLDTVGRAGRKRGRQAGRSQFSPLGAGPLRPEGRRRRRRAGKGNGELRRTHHVRHLRQAPRKVRTGGGGGGSRAVTRKAERSDHKKGDKTQKHRVACGQGSVSSALHPSALTRRGGAGGGAGGAGATDRRRVLLLPDRAAQPVGLVDEAVVLEPRVIDHLFAVGVGLQLLWGLPIGNAAVSHDCTRRRHSAAALSGGDVRGGLGQSMLVYVPECAQTFTVKRPSRRRQLPDSTGGRRLVTRGGA